MKLACTVLLLSTSIVPAASQDAAEFGRRNELGLQALIDGRYAEAIPLLESVAGCELLSDEDRGYAAYNVACCYARLGELTSAFEWYERSVEFGDLIPAEQVLSDPDLGNLRGDPRWKSLEQTLELKVAGEQQLRASAAAPLRAALERTRDLVGSSSVTWLDGHQGRALRVRLSPDGERAVTWAEDGSAWLWNAWTGEPLGLLGLFVSDKLFGRWDYWLQLDFSADGERVLAFEPFAGFAGLWDGRSAEFLGTLEVGQQVVCAVALDLEGRRIATADEAGVVRLFDADLGAPIADSTFEATGVQELSFSSGGERLLALTVYGRAYLWDLASGSELGDLNNSGYFLDRAGFDHEGQRVLAVGIQIGGPVGLIFEIEEPGSPASVPKVLQGPDGEWAGVDWGAGGDVQGIQPLAFWTPAVRPRGKHLIVVDHEGVASLWDATTGERTATLEGSRASFEGHAMDSWLGFNPDGTRLLILHGDEGQLWNVEDGRRITDLVGERAPYHGQHATFSPNGRHLATTTAYRRGGPAKIETRLFDGLTGELMGELALGDGSAWGLQFGPDGRLAVPSADGTVYIWDGANPPLPLRAHAARIAARERSGNTMGADGSLGPGGARMSLDGSLAVSVGSTPDGPLVRLWDLSSGGIVRELEPGRWTSGWFLGSGELLLVGASMSGPKTDVQIQDARSGAVHNAFEIDVNPRAQRILINPERTRLLSRTDKECALHDLEREEILTTFSAIDVALSPRGDYAVASELFEDVDPFMVLRELATGERRETLLEASWGTPVFSGDGSLLASGYEEIRVWDLDAHDPPRHFAGHGEDISGARELGLSGVVASVAFDAESRRMVSTGTDGKAHIWSLTEDREPIVLRGHRDFVDSARFSPDGLRVLTTSEDATARLWTASTGEERAVLGHLGPVTRAEFSPSGDRILTLSMDGTTRIWSGSPDSEGRLLATRVDYDDGWVVFEPGGHYIAGGNGAERAQINVRGRRYPLSSYASVYRSQEKITASLAGEVVRAPAFVPQAPELRIAAPLDAVIADRTFRIEALVEDAYGISDVSASWTPDFSADSEPLDIDQGSKTARLTWQLTLPEGENQLIATIRVRNRRGIFSSQRRIQVRWEPPQRELYVLALGVTDYDDDSLDLAYPTKDADDLIARFKAEEGGFYQKVNVQRLVDGEVTPGKLRRAREEFLLRAQPEDTILVFAAGHGVRSDSGEYYFLTPSTTPDDPYDGVERQMLESLVTWDRLHADRRILLLDTCHSGEAFGQGKRGVALESFDQAEVDEAAGTGLYIIAASSEAGFAQEMKGNGLFTKALLEGLDGAADINGDGLVGIDELKSYTTTAVHERSGGRQRPTAPRVEGGENFPLVRAR